METEAGNQNKLYKIFCLIAIFIIVAMGAAPKSKAILSNSFGDERKQVDLEICGLPVVRIVVGL